MIGIIPLTVMSDVGGSTRSENGGNVEIIEVGSVCGGISKSWKV